MFSVLEAIENAKGLLSVREVASIFGLSQQTVYTMAAEKELPSLKFRGSLRFDPKALGYYLRKQDPTLAAAARN